MESLYILGLDGKILIEKNYGKERKLEIVSKLYNEYF